MLFTNLFKATICLLMACAFYRNVSPHKNKHEAGVIKSCKYDDRPFLIKIHFYQSVYPANLSLILILLYLKFEQ